jgi:hypothetical protein
VSEYQYYEFQAVDAGLSAQEMAQLRSISTRATITAVSFVNEYHWGDLRADPDKLLRRYFDAFLYTANWGTRRLAFRLPVKVLSAQTAQEYCYTEAAQVSAHGRHLVLELCCSGEYSDERFEDGPTSWDEVDTGEGRLASMISARAQVVNGDLRLLYLGWLLSADLGLLEDDELEPPVPANLNHLSVALDGVVDFFGLDPCLVAAAAQASESVADTGPSEQELRDWIAGLSRPAKDALLLKVAQDQDPHIGAQLRRQALTARTIQKAPQTPAHDGSHDGQLRTAGQLLYRAAQLRQEQRQRAAKAEQREQERLDREAYARQQERLDALDRIGDQAWNRLPPLLTNSKPKEYDQAVRLLIDLRDLHQRRQTSDEFGRRLADLRARHARRTALIRRLDEADL